MQKELLVIPRQQVNQAPYYRPVVALRVIHGSYIEIIVILIVSYMVLNMLMIVQMGMIK